MTQHLAYVWHPLHCRWQHTHPLYHTKPQYLWCHIHFRHDNTAPVSDIAPTVSVSSHRLHWNLTHYIWHHSHLISVITPAVSMISQQVWKSSPLAHIWHHTHSPWNDIHNLWYQCSVLMTSQPLHSGHEISYIWHLIHCLWHLMPYNYDITPTLSVSSHPMYLFYQTQCTYDNTATIYGIICTAYDIKPLYLWNQVNYIWHHIHYI